MKKLLIFISLSLFINIQSYAQEDDTAAREFIRSATYGVLAGTLVGAATLAFTEQPGENLSRVARGASLGLYAGILLGLYVVYVVPSQLQKENQLLEEQGLPPSEDEYYEEGGMKWGVFPIISQNGIEGVATQFEILQF